MTRNHASDPVTGLCSNSHSGSRPNALAQRTRPIGWEPGLHFQVASHGLPLTHIGQEPGDPGQRAKFFSLFLINNVTLENNFSFLLLELVIYDMPAATVFPKEET